MGAKTQALGPPCTAFPDALAGCWLGSGAAGPQTSAHMGAGTAGGSFIHYSTALALYATVSKRVICIALAPADDGSNVRLLGGSRGVTEAGITGQTCR